MSKKLFLNALIAICFALNAFEANAALQTVANPNVESIFELDAQSLLHNDKKELEAEIGRKLTFKERVVLNLVKRKLNKHANLNGVDATEQIITDGMAIAGFVTGLVSIFIFGVILGILGIIFSSIALRRIRVEPETRRGQGLAIAGLVLGIVGLVGWVIVVAAVA